MPVIQHLVADEFGSHVGKYSGRLKVTRKGQTLVQAPLLHLESVMITNRGVSVSAEAILACTERGIPIHFLSYKGTPYAALYSAGLVGTVMTRRAQLMAYHDERAVRLGVAFARGKIENQANLLKYVAKYRKEKEPETFDALRLLVDEVREHLGELDRLLLRSLNEGLLIDDVRGKLLSVEGRAAQAYWKGIKLVIPEGLEWPGRERRGARDGFNSALNYAYGMLYSKIEHALVLAGLDPYGGYIHTDRPGKLSLVFDFIEEFRAPVVDRTVVGWVNKGSKIEQDERSMLTDKTREQLRDKIKARLDGREKYEKKRHTLRNIIQMQARHLATYVRGERESYEPFITKW